MINIYAPINILGYGIHSSNMIKALTELNQDMNLTVLGQTQVDPYFEAYWQTAQKNLKNFDAKSPSLFIFHDEFSHQSCGNPLFVFSIFETTKLKEQSLAILKNGPADIILTTTKKHKELLDEQNIGKEVRVLNEGIDDTIYNTIPVDPHLDTQKFTFITVGKKEERKNTNKIIKAFLEIAKDKEAALIAHTFNLFLHNQQSHPFKNMLNWTDINPMDYGFEYKGWIEKGHLFTNGKSDLYLTTPNIQTAEMPCLYHSANVGIQCSRGEGWDLPLTEIMGCGLPSIATDCLGHSEYLEGAPELQKELIIPITGTITANDTIWFKGEQGEWGKVSEDDIKSKINYVLDNKDKFSPKSEELATYMTDNYLWTKAAQSFVDMIQ